MDGEVKDSDAIKKEIEEHFGFFPPFFAPALDSPETLANLWCQTLWAYVRNPLPPFFKEKLFAYLSRYCSVPYCIICHSCALHPLGMKPEELLRLLESPSPFLEKDLATHFSLLSTQTAMPEKWPAPGSALEVALFFLSIYSFLHPSQSENIHLELKRVLGSPLYSHWSSFLAYIKSCHYWIETHPEVSYRADDRFIQFYQPLIDGEPRLEAFFHHYREKVQQEKDVKREEFTQEIIQLEHMEKAIREKEERFRSFFEYSSIGMVITSLEGRFQRVNKAFCEMLGYSQEEVLQKTFMEITHTDDLGKDIEFVKELLSGKIHSFQMEKRYIHKNGKPFWIRLNASVILNGENRPRFFIGQIENIESRKRTEEILRESEMRFRGIFENAATGVVIASLDGRFVQVNNHLCQTLGYGPLDLPGKSFDEIIHPDDLKKALEPYGKVKSGEKRHFSIELRFLHREGSPVWCLLSLSIMADLAGKPELFIATVQDITDRKKAREERHRLEVQIQKAQKLKALGVLAGGIAHDFNNLLMGVLGNAELAMEELSPGSSAYDYLYDIHKTATKASNLSKQMLAYSGRGRFNITMVDLNEFIHEMAPLLKEAIPPQINLRFHFSPSPLPALADLSQMRQVLLNILTNGWEAMGEKGGILFLSTGRALWEEQADKQGLFSPPAKRGPHVYFEVSDEGSGMEPETVEKVFDPFFTTKFTGRGLGMAVVMGILHGHKGVVEIETEVGKGSTFRVLLPEVARPADKEQESISPAKPKAKGKILLVDDMEDVRSVGERMLKAIGYEVITAIDGENAVEIFKEHRKEIIGVILDLSMPRLDGEECFNKLQQIREGVPVIIASGYDEQEVSQRFGGKKVAGFIQKPFSVKDLKEKVEGAF